MAVRARTARATSAERARGTTPLAPMARAKDGDIGNISFFDVDFEALPGYGLRACVNGERVDIGANRLLEKLGLDARAALPSVVALAEQGKTPLYIAIGGRLAAVIAVAFLPAFVPEDFNLALGIFILGCVWTLTSMCWYLPLVFSIGKASNFFANQRSRKVLTLISCFGLLVLAFLLAIS